MKANEIIAAMSLAKAKNNEYPDATPAVHMALNKARKQCAVDATSLVE